MQGKTQGMFLWISSQLIEAALQGVDESAENYFVVYLNGKQNPV